jgi:Holliday junction resolvase RusA-like endonuclease
MSDPFTVRLVGTPDKRLTPNARIHHLRRSDLTRDLRQCAFLAAKVGRPLFTGPVVLTERIFWGKGQRKTDLSAIPLLCKAIEDGLTDAEIWIDDAQVVRLIAEQGKDRDGTGYVELIVEDA